MDQDYASGSQAPHFALLDISLVNGVSCRLHTRALVPRTGSLVIHINHDSHTNHDSYINHDSHTNHCYAVVL
jgi:hypothetical protein